MASASAATAAAAAAATDAAAAAADAAAAAAATADAAAAAAAATAADAAKIAALRANLCAFTDAAVEPLGPGHADVACLMRDCLIAILGAKTAANDRERDFAALIAGSDAPVLGDAERAHPGDRVICLNAIATLYCRSNDSRLLIVTGVFPLAYSAALGLDSLPVDESVSHLCAHVSPLTNPALPDSICACSIIYRCQPSSAHVDAAAQLNCVSSTLYPRVRRIGSSDGPSHSILLRLVHGTLPACSPDLFENTYMELRRSQRITLFTNRPV